MKKIAARLNLPEETVETNLKAIRQKLGVQYWTEVNPKFILKGFWHRIRKGK
jgi:DNA-binding NarL/FixJ family response regulator